MPRNLGAAAVLVVALALSACTPTTAGPTTASPSAAPTTAAPTPSTTGYSDAALLEEARATYDGYLSALADAYENPAEARAILSEWASGPLVEAEVSAIESGAVPPQISTSRFELSAQTNRDPNRYYVWACLGQSSNQQATEIEVVRTPSGKVLIRSAIPLAASVGFACN